MAMYVFLDPKLRSERELHIQIAFLGGKSDTGESRDQESLLLSYYAPLLFGWFGFFVLFFSRNEKIRNRVN